DETFPSLGFYLAALYLKAQGIEPELTSDNQVKLGSTIFPEFHPNDGGYVNAQVGGYQILINYQGPPQHFQRIPITAVLANKFPPELVRDRIVLIGATAESLKDLFYTPYSSRLLSAPERMPGVIIHANLTSQILNTVLQGQPLIQTWADPWEWTWVIFWATVGAVLSWQGQRHGRTKRQQLRFPIHVLAAMILLLGSSYLSFQAGWWIPVIPPLFALVGSIGTIVGYIAYTSDEMRRTFGRYLTDEVVSNLLETPGGLQLGGARRKVTVLFSDLRGFSAMSERITPEEVVNVLNLYLKIMADVVSQYQGTINEIMGDGILIMFGAPLYREDDADRAVACAIAMQQAMDTVNEQMRQRDFPELQMGIGINTGEVIVGNIGSDKRAKYTIIGAHVNLAARVEACTVGGQVLISENTYKEIGSILQIDGEMQVELKGIKHPTTLYEISGIGGAYNCFRSQHQESLLPLPAEIPLQYVLLEGKSTAGRIYQGSLIQLSELGAVLKSEGPIDPLTNVKINLLLSSEAGLELDEVYAKVMKSPINPESGIYIRFTNLSPAVTQILKGHLNAAKTTNSSG
ncbi:MAG: adenylate/guanylate cyclase domain-containing protein, partial [Leptolyngbyaceae bacterium]|nr:adenylate/guanylate cyclase domain-containing protein [Leptolyngbyaceae bacterium]